MITDASGSNPIGVTRDISMWRVEFDTVTRPRHYTENYHHEPIDVIEDWGLDYHLGNVVKYISRAGRKGPPLEDLQKAQWYLNRAIERMKGEENE